MHIDEGRSGGLFRCSTSTRFKLKVSSNLDEQSEIHLADRKAKYQVFIGPLVPIFVKVGTMETISKSSLNGRSIENNICKSFSTIGE